MAVELKLRRDVEADIDAMTPAEGEAIYDITNKRLRVGDGSTAGGTPLAVESETATGSTTARTMADRFADSINPKDFGASPTASGTANVTAIQAAMDAVPTGGTLLISESYPVDGSGSPAPTELFLRTEAIQIRGQGLGSGLVVAAAVGASTDIFRFAPEDAGEVYLWAVSDLNITVASGTPGRHAFNLDTEIAGTFFQGLTIERVRVTTIGGRAIQTTNTNLNGGVFNAVISHNIFSRGISLIDGGDSIHILHNVISGTDTGINAVLVADAGNLVIAFNNLSSDKGMITIGRADGIIIAYNEIEQQNTNTQSNNAMVDLAGGTARICSVNVVGNIIQSLASTGDPDILRVGLVDDLFIDGNRFSAIPPGSSILITANAINTRIGAGNEFLGAGTKVANSGVYTTHQSAPLVYSSIASSTAIANTTTPTAFSKTFQFPANTLQIGNVIRIRAGGIFSTDGAGAPTIALKTRLNGTAYTNSNETLPASLTTKSWYLETDLVVRTIGSSGTIRAGLAHGGFVGIDSSTSPGIVPTAGTLGLITQNTTVAITVDIQVTWGAAQTGHTITLEQLTVELLKTGTAD